MFFVGVTQRHSGLLERASVNLHITGNGSVQFDTTGTIVTIEHALLVLDIGVHLVSFIKMENKEVGYSFVSGKRALTLGSSVISQLDVKSELMTVRLMSIFCVLTD